MNFLRRLFRRPKQCYITGPHGFKGIFINETEAMHYAYIKYGPWFVNCCKFEMK